MTLLYLAAGETGMAIGDALACLYGAAEDALCAVDLALTDFGALLSGVDE